MSPEPETGGAAQRPEGTEELSNGEAVPENVTEAAEESAVPEVVAEAAEESAVPEVVVEAAEESAVPEVVVEAAEESAVPEVVAEAAEESAVPEVVVEAAESTTEADEDALPEVVSEAAEGVAIPEAVDEAGELVPPTPPMPRPERPAISKPADIGDIPDDPTADDFADAVERTVFEFNEGDIVAGTVVGVDQDEVLVDIGFKSEGVIPLKELSIRNAVDPHEVVAIGEAIEALVLSKEDEDGRLVLSKKRAQYERAWGRIERVMHEGGTVTGPVIEVVKGGLIVDIGLRGFLPASLVDLRRVRDLQPYVGQPIEAKVIELDRNRNNVVLSRRAYLEEAQAEQRQSFLAGLEPGDIREGVVSSVVNFGAFVDLGGMDGLVHVSELSWQHVSHPSEVVTVGDKIPVKVLEVDRDRERISLSMRQTRDDPWVEFAGAHGIGDVVDGKVTKTVPFGAFVSVGEGVEGLVHVSEIATHHVESPELELSIGQDVKVKITEVDGDRRRVSLSIKQASPDWEERSQWDRPERPTTRRREFQRDEETTAEEPSFNADASLEAILKELKERGIGRK
jgi:small subunit ribosomal protein S1